MRLSEYFNLTKMFWGHLVNTYSLPVDELVKDRKYFADHPFTQASLDMVFVPYDAPPDVSEYPFQLGLSDPEGGFLLAGRYVTPIRLPDGRIVAFVGWSPNASSYKMKYLTTSSLPFKKKYLFYGSSGNFSFPSHLPLFVVEGIFDCLALQSVGLPSVSLMGKSLSQWHRDQLPLFKRRVIGVPDTDSLDIIHRDSWGISSLPKASYLSWGSSFPCKDMDDMVKFYGSALFSFLEQIRSEPQFHVRLEVG